MLIVITAVCCNPGSSDCRGYRCLFRCVLLLCCSCLWSSQQQLFFVTDIAIVIVVVFIAVVVIVVVVIVAVVLFLLLLLLLFLFLSFLVRRPLSSSLSYRCIVGHRPCHLVNRAYHLCSSCLSSSFIVAVIFILRLLSMSRFSPIPIVVTTPS